MGRQGWYPKIPEWQPHAGWNWNSASHKPTDKLMSGNSCLALGFWLVAYL